MQLTNEQREQVRLSILRYGLGSFTVGLSRQYLASEGFKGLSKEEVQLEIDYLEQKGLVRKLSKLISPENRSYSTSAEGRDFLAESGIS